MMQKEDAEEIDTSLSSVSIGRRPLCNLWFADDIDLLGGSEEESSPIKPKSMSTASIQGHPSTNMWMNGKALEEVDQLKHLGSTQTKDGTSITEAKIRMVQAYSAMTRSNDMEK